MNDNLRDRIVRKLEALSDERGYQVLDYVEFLESKYAEQTQGAPSVFTRFAEAVEDKMRAGRMSATTIAETMGLLNRAMGVLNGVAAAGRSVANDVVTAARQAGTNSAPSAGQSPSSDSSSATPSPPSSPASPDSGEQHP